MALCLSYFNEKYCFVNNVNTDRIFKGLAEDLGLLRKEFLACNSTSFKSFAGVWRKLKFTSIFCHRTSATEIMEFTQGVLHYSKGYVFARDLIASVFGIYLVYSVYFKQLIRNKTMKLRLTLEEFSELAAILEKMANAGHLDAVSIFFRMYDKGAIHFVAGDLEAGMETGFKKYFSNSNDDGRHHVQPSAVPFEPGLLDSLVDVLEIYNTNKRKAFKNSEAFSSSSDFIPNMQRALSHFGTLNADDGDFDTATSQSLTDATGIATLGSRTYKSGVKRTEMKNRAYKKDASAFEGEEMSQKNAKRLNRPKSLPHFFTQEIAEETGNEYNGPADDDEPQELPNLLADEPTPTQKFTKEDIDVTESSGYED